MKYLDSEGYYYDIMQYNISTKKYGSNSRFSNSAKEAFSTFLDKCTHIYKSKEIVLEELLDEGTYIEIDENSSYEDIINSQPEFFI